jgi:hypothetical protein
MSYEEARIEALERELKSVSIFVRFIKEHYQHAYLDATINNKIVLNPYTTESQIDTN